MEEEAFIWWRSLTTNKKKKYIIIYSLPNTWITKESDISFEVLTKVYKKYIKSRKMKTFKVGDKVKVTGNQSNSAFKLHGKTCTICEVGKNYYGLEEEITLNVGFGGVHHHEVELVSEYNKTFNPEAHSSLIIDFDKHESLLIEAIENNKVETIEEASIKEIPELKHIINDVTTVRNIAIKLAKSDAARNHWFKIFQEEQKTI